VEQPPHRHESEALGQPCGCGMRPVRPRGQRPGRAREHPLEHGLSEAEAAEQRVDDQVEFAASDRPGRDHPSVRRVAGRGGDDGGAPAGVEIEARLLVEGVGAVLLRGGRGDLEERLPLCGIAEVRDGET